MISEKIQTEGLDKNVFYDEPAFETAEARSVSSAAVKPRNLIYFWITFVIIALDQITKILIRANLEYGEIWRITPKLIWITYIQNKGAAFSLSFGSNELNRILFLSISGIASVLLIYLLLRAEKKTDKIIYSMILGGAIGNLIDRLLLGGVTDFIWLDFPDWIMHRWPVFNVADSSIVIAITIMLVHTVFFDKRITEDK